MCSLLRDVRYDDRLKLLTSLPIAEYARLHGQNVVAPGLPGTTVAPGASHAVTLGQPGRQLDIDVTFKLPPAGTSQASVGVSVLRSADGSERTDVTVSNCGGSTPTGSERVCYLVRRSLRSLRSAPFPFFFG
jgi:hypothetical protein